MTHKASIRGEAYKELKNTNEMGLLRYLTSNKDININIDNIIKMYQILTNDANATFRDKNIQILTGKKFYVPTSKDNIYKEMKELCDKYSYLNNASLDNLDDIFKFILEFICIHPFSNGNGRLSALLIMHLLTKLGLVNALYIPLDALMNGIYISRTTQEIRKASGFFYKMKEYEYDSYIIYMKEILMKSYTLLLDSIK